MHRCINSALNRDVYGVNVIVYDRDGNDIADAVGVTDVIADCEPNAHCLSDAGGYAVVQPYAFAHANGFAQCEQNDNGDQDDDPFQYGDAVCDALRYGDAVAIPITVCDPFVPSLALVHAHGQCVAEAQVIFHPPPGPAARDDIRACTTWYVSS